MKLYQLFIYVVTFAIVTGYMLDENTGKKYKYQEYDVAVSTSTAK